MSAESPGHASVRRSVRSGRTSSNVYATVRIGPSVDGKVVAIGLWQSDQPSSKKRKTPKSGLSSLADPDTSSWGYPSAVDFSTWFCAYTKLKKGSEKTSWWEETARFLPSHISRKFLRSIVPKLAPLSNGAIKLGGHRLKKSHFALGLLFHGILLRDLIILNIPIK